MKIVLNIVLFLVFLSNLKSQEIMPTGAKVSVSWDANPEPELAGYRVKIGNQTGNWPTVYNVGNVTEFLLPVELTPGYWYSVVIAHAQDPTLDSEPSDELTMRSRQAYLQYSFNGVDWLIDRPKAFVEASAHVPITPSKRKLSIGNSHKLFRYLYLDELQPPPTLPNTSVQDTHLQWDVPHPLDKVIKFNIYRKVNANWVLQDFVYPPSLSYRTQGFGEYSISATNVQMGEGLKSDPVTVYYKPLPPTLLRKL